MPQYKILISVVLACFLFSFAAQAKILTEDVIANHYEVTLSSGDEGTVYFSSDGSLNYLPFITNNTYVHICWGEWKFNEKTQRLLIKDFDRCRVLEGNYQLKPIPMGYELRDSGKTFTLRKFHKL